MTEKEYDPKDECDACTHKMVAPCPDDGGRHCRKRIPCFGVDYVETHHMCIHCGSKEECKEETYQNYIENEATCEHLMEWQP